MEPLGLYVIGLRAQCLMAREAGQILVAICEIRGTRMHVFARSNTGIVDSNPTRGMDVCLRCVVLYR
jgi:hypothetical protein